MRRDSATIGSDYGVVDFNAVRPWRDSILGGDFNTLSTDLVVHFDRPEGQTNHRLPEFSANVTPATSARSARKEDQYIYFCRTEARSTQRPASHPPKLDMGLHILCTPIPGPKIFYLAQSLTRAAPRPLFPQQRTHRRGIASAPESRHPKSAFPSRADLWRGRL